MTSCEKQQYKEYMNILRELSKVVRDKRNEITEDKGREVGVCEKYYKVTTASGEGLTVRFNKSDMFITGPLLDGRHSLLVSYENAWLRLFAKKWVLGKQMSKRIR